MLVRVRREREWKGETCLPPEGNNNNKYRPVFVWLVRKDMSTCESASRYRAGEQWPDSITTTSTTTLFLSFFLGGMRVGKITFLGSLQSA